MTSGSDGDIRLWESYSDEDPSAFGASDGCFSLASYKDHVLVGTESNTVEAFKIPSGEEVGVQTKFTSGVHHVDVSHDSSFFVAGSGYSRTQ